MQNKSETSNEKILISKVLDKQKFCLSKNKVTHTDFLNQREKTIIRNNLNLQNCFFYGVCDNPDREIIVFYPEKLNEELAKRTLDKVLTVIRIDLPNDLKGEFEHRSYLSALIKIGMTREKIGDILVDFDGADIIIFSINKDYIMQSLQQLTRFRKAHIYEIDIDNIKDKEEKFEERNIIVSSMRIDNIVSELANCSRNKSEELIESERVYINYEVILKNSKIVNIKDIITIRGKGKFIIDGLVRNTKSEKLVVKTRKYA